VEKLTLPSAFDCRFFIPVRVEFACVTTKFSPFSSLKFLLLPFYLIFQVIVVQLFNIYLSRFTPDF